MIRLACAAGVLAAIMGCASTIERRIATDRELFDTYPPEIQQNIRAGVVKPGYTREMARIALGPPDHRYTRVTEEIREEIWIYSAARPRFSIGIGGATGGSRTAVGTGVGIHTAGREEEAIRIRFHNDTIHAIEQRLDE